MPNAQPLESSTRDTRDSLTGKSRVLFHVQETGGMAWVAVSLLGGETPLIYSQTLHVHYSLLSPYRGSWEM